MLNPTTGTGTPEGVGPIKPGDVVTCGIEGLMQMKFEVKADEAE